MVYNNLIKTKTRKKVKSHGYMENFSFLCTLLNFKIK